MLQKISVAEVKHVAEMAKVVRTARDEMLVGIPEEDLGEPQPARGQHIPSARLGFDPLEPDHPARRALREAIASLRLSARRELRALAWMGRGDYAAKDFERAVADASASDGDTTTGALLDQADLHNLLMKGLYELELV